MKSYTVACLSGDGIGPELMAEASRAVAEAGRLHGFRVNEVHAPFAGEAVSRCGHPLPPETRAACRESEAVLRAGRKLASVLESLPIGVIITDASGRVCQMNEGALRLLKSVSAIESDAYGELLAWWERNAARVKRPSGEATHNQRVQVECVDGTTKNVLESTSPLRSADGKIVGAVIVMQDVTEPNKYEADFEQRIASLVSIGIDLERATERARD